MFRVRITVKVTLLICAITLVIVGVGIFFGYQWASDLLLNTVEQNQQNVSGLTLRYLTELFERKLNLLEGYVLSPMLISAVKTANFRSDSYEMRDIQETVLVLDKQWRRAGKTDALVKDRLEKGKKLGLMGLIGADADIGEIFLTDRFGGIVACSEKTSDFYQGDEEWWQKAFNEGRGNIYIGDFTFDESAGFWSFTFALPIIDEAGKAIGVCKAIIDLKHFFSPLNIFRVSQSGEFTLVNEAGVVIYHYGVNPFTTSFCLGSDFSKILQSKKRQGVVFSPLINKKVFVVVTDFDYPFLLERAIDLKIIVSHDAQEVLKPLETLFRQRVLVSILLLALMIILGFISGRTVTGPIKKLHRAALQVAKGDYSVKTAIRTHDELQELGSVFDTMVMSIKEKQERLQEQAKELSEAQQQTLEALNETKEKQKQIEAYTQKLRHSNQDLEQFAYIVSHDLQEPLRMITGFLQILEKRYKGRFDKDADEFIGYAVDGAKRMRALIDTILAYSRVSSAQIELKPVDCQQLLKAIVVNLSVSIAERKAQVTYDPLPTVMFDATQLGQVFQNLVGNAIKYGKKESPKVHIGFQKKEDEWLFFVRDDGIGIAQQDLERIFQIFQRVDAKAAQPGSGIGLAVCKKIIERHGGRIWVESEPGRGSVFSFTIPQSPKK